MSSLKPARCPTTRTTQRPRRYTRCRTPPRRTFRSRSRRAATPSTRALRLGRGRRLPRSSALCGRRPGAPDAHPQRAEAVPGDAVRRGAAGWSASAIAGRRWRCCAPVIRASRGTSTPSPDMLAARRQHGGRPPVRHARARILRRARRSAAAAAVFAARAQLLGQAQRHARVLRPVRTAEGELPRVRSSAAAGHPARGRAFHVACRKPGSWRASTAARRRITRSRSGASRWPSHALRRTRTMPHYGRAPRVLADAMTAHPEMVSGERRNDLALMRAGRGDWVTQGRRRGRPGDRRAEQRGSGSPSRSSTVQNAGLHPATVATLDQLGLLDAAGRAELAPWGEPAVRNYRGTVTGSVRSVVVLDKRSGSLNGLE